MKIMKGVNPRKLIITIAVLAVIGTIVMTLIYRANPVQRDWVVIVCDMLFAQASAIIIWGIIRALGNARMFTSASYSFKRFHDVFRNKVMKAEVMKEDYLTYRENRPYHNDAKPILLIGMVWMVVAVVAAMLAPSLP